MREFPADFDDFAGTSLATAVATRHGVAAKPTANGDDRDGLAAHHFRSLEPISRELFPALAEEVGSLPENHRRIVRILDQVEVERFVPAQRCVPGHRRLHTAENPTNEFPIGIGEPFACATSGGFASWVSPSLTRLGKSIGIATTCKGRILQEALQVPGTAAFWACQVTVFFTFLGGGFSPMPAYIAAWSGSAMAVLRMCGDRPSEAAPVVVRQMNMVRFWHCCATARKRARDELGTTRASHAIRKVDMVSTSVTDNHIW